MAYAFDEPKCSCFRHPTTTTLSRHSETSYNGLPGSRTPRVAVWAPTSSSSAAVAIHGRQREVSARCPVRIECGDYAQSFEPALVGIWGGTSSKERLSLGRTR